MKNGARIGIAHHFGWAIAVTATNAHAVVDRRRIELIEPGVGNAPIHHQGKSLDDEACAALVATVRASVRRATASSLDALAADVRAPIVSLSIRSWPTDFPTDIATQRTTAYEAKADSIMYLEALADAAAERAWDLHLFKAKDVESQAALILGAKADVVLHGPRERLGAPWNADHRVALAATVVASHGP